MWPRIDLADPAFLADRKASYRIFRQEKPVALAEINGEDVVIVSRFADAELLLRHPKVGVQPQPGEIPAHLGSGPASIYYRYSVPSVDAPDHHRLRKIFNPLLGPRALEKLKATMGDIIRRKTSEIEGDTEVEFVSRLAFGIPTEVTCALLDIPIEDAPLLLSHFPDMTAIMSQAEMSADLLGRSDRAAQLYFDYFESHLRRHENLPSDRITSALLAAERDGALHRHDVYCALMDMFIGSIHTTMTSFTNAVIAFATHPDQYALLKDNPALIEPAWEEVLRFDAPVHFRHRYANAPIEVCDRIISPGMKVMIALAAANGDEARFEEADKFRIDRISQRHLAFGGGGHLCLGIYLARLEGQLFLSELISRFDAVALADKPILRNQDLTFPHVEQLYVEFIGAGRDKRSGT